MRNMTASNLRSAFGGESMAHVRYQVWADNAEGDGFPTVARLFRAISAAEVVHASNHFRELGSESGAYLVASMAGFGLGTTSENLAGAIEGEAFEVKEMYPAYLETARLQEEIGAQQSFQYALSAEKIHAAMFTRAKQAVDAGRDPELGPVQVCNVSGYTTEGEVPDKCPVCGMGKDKFQTFA